MNNMQRAREDIHIKLLPINHQQSLWEKKYVFTGGQILKGAKPLD